LADLFFYYYYFSFGWLVRCREKRIITRFFRFRLSGVRQISRFIFPFFAGNGWSVVEKSA
jgi:hypothetical protein